MLLAAIIANVFLLTRKFQSEMQEKTDEAG
jgi:hypothetical protein